MRSDGKMHGMPDLETWFLMPQEEKEEWLRTHEGFLLPLVLKKALDRGVLKLKPDENLSDILKSPDKARRVYLRIKYRDRPDVICDAIRDLAEYIRFVEFKTDEMRMGWLYAYFPSHNILMHPDTIILQLIYNGIRGEIYDTQYEVASKLRKEAPKITLQDIDPPDFLPLERGKVLDLNDFKVKDNTGKYFRRGLEYYPSEGFLANIEKVTEDYFENEGWFEVIRKHYDDENWERLKLCLGTILAGRNTREKITVITGESMTRKTILLSGLIYPALKHYTAGMCWGCLTKRSYLKYLIGAKVLLAVGEDWLVSHIKPLARMAGGDTFHIDKLGNVKLNLAVFVETNYKHFFPRSTSRDLLSMVNLVETTNPQLWIYDDFSIKKLNIGSFLEFLIYCTFLLKKRGWIVKDEEERERVYKLLIRRR
jgi:hypothetical protein